VSTPASTASELSRLGAVELAGKIARREVSAREAVEAALARIEAVNPALSAVRVVLADEALAAADEADRRAGAGEELGPLHGVPITVKENLDVAGTATSSGVSALVEATAARDAPSVAGLRAAGAIPVGRTNLAELGFRWHSFSGAGGHTVNPWNSELTPGGSSGGDAVALATGMVALGVGNDLGGSLRIPSQFNGTAAIKPTFGRVGEATTVPPLDGVLAIQLMAVNGPMARQVEDLRAALGPISAYDPRDPWQAPVPLQGPPLEPPIRVTVCLWDGVHPDVADGVRRAADALAGAGYEVEEGEPPRIEEAREQWVRLVVNEFRAAWPEIAPVASDPATRFVELAFEVVEPMDPMEHGMSYVNRQAVARDWAEFQAERPLVLAPVCGRPPWEVDHDLSGPEAVVQLLEDMRMIGPVNNLGLPSAAVPVGEAGGLPQGVQVIGPRWREDLCLDAAAAIEAAFGTLTPIDPR
jgi:amidase